MKAGDVVLVSFPFADQEAWKVRPAVVIASVEIGGSCDLIVAMITSNRKRVTEYDLPLDASDTEFSATGLQRPGMLRTHRLVTLEATMIRRTLGKLGEGTWQRLMASLSRLLNLS